MNSIPIAHATNRKMRAAFRDAEANFALPHYVYMRILNGVLALPRARESAEGVRADRSGGQPGAVWAQFPGSTRVCFFGHQTGAPRGSVRQQTGGRDAR